MTSCFVCPSLCLLHLLHRLDQVRLLLQLTQITLQITGLEIRDFDLLDHVIAILNSLVQDCAVDLEAHVFALTDSVLEVTNLNKAFVDGIKRSAVAIHGSLLELALLDEFNCTVKWVVDISIATPVDDSAEAVESVDDVIKIQSFLLLVLLGGNILVLLSNHLQFLHFLKSVDALNQHVNVNQLNTLVSSVFGWTRVLLADTHIMQHVVTASVEVVDVSCFDLVLETVFLVPLFSLFAAGAEWKENRASKNVALVSVLGISKLVGIGPEFVNEVVVVRSVAEHVDALLDRLINGYVFGTTAAHDIFNLLNQ